jgi:hypothetical protein
LLFILVTCSQFDSYLLSFSSTGSTFNSYKNSLILFVVKKFVPGCSAKKFHLDLSVLFILFFWGSKFRPHVKEWRDPVVCTPALVQGDNSM